MPIELYESATAVANAAGKAVCRLQPLRAFETWAIRSLSIISTSSVKIPTFKAYRGSETPSNFIGGTYSGQVNNDPNFNEDLPNGVALVGVFENCDVGASCTMIIKGAKDR